MPETPDSENAKQQQEDALKALETINMLLSPTHSLDPTNRERVYFLQELFLRQLRQSRHR